MNLDALMRKITKADYPVDVFRVSVFKGDTSELYTAQATLRGDGQNYSASGLDSLKALEELDRLLHSLKCPTCGR